MTGRCVLILVITLFPSLAAAQEKVQSVCEILEHLDRFTGKLVSVRAKIESVWLVAEDCRAAIRVEGVKFDNLLAIDWPGSPMLKHKGPMVPFGFDEPSFRRLESVIGSTDNRTDSVYADVEGLVVTRNPPLALVVRARGRNIPVGFGHLGLAPAELIVKQISNIETVPRK